MHVYRNAFDNVGIPIATWAEFIARVTAECERGETSPLPFRGKLVTDKRTLAAFAPHIAQGGRRKADPDPVCDLAYLDLDDLPDLAPLESLDGLAYLVHTTPSDKGPGTSPRKVRVYARVDRPILPEECARFRQGFAKVLGVQCDPSTLDAKRIGFAGRVAGDPPRQIWVEPDGACIPVDAILATMPAAQPHAPAPPTATADVPDTWIEGAAAMLAEHWHLGSRNALALGLGGWCAMRGIPREQCAELVERMPSTDPQARVDDAMRAYDVAEAGEPVRGWAALRDHLPADALAAFEARVPAPHLEMARELEARAAARHANRAQRPAQAQRPDVIGDTTDPEIDAALPVLAKAGVYQRSGSLVEVRRAPVEVDDTVLAAGRPVIGSLLGARLVELLQVRVGPWAAKWAGTIVARGQWDYIPPLEGIASYPVLRPNGTVLCGSGYDSQTKTYAHIELVPSIGETQADAQAALALLRDLVCDFPFEGEQDFAAWLCGLLSPLAKPAVDGACPLTLLDASTRGAGKTLLADLIGLIVIGRALPRLSSPSNEEEMGKLLFATLREGAAIAFFDNVTTMLRSADLDKILTGTEYEGRVLGESRRETLPIRTTFIASMNNVRLSTDLVRRSVQCRLEPQGENPEARTNFRHPDILAHVLAERERYLGAALTLLRAYAAAERPEVHARPMGSYTTWARVVRDAIVWAGGVDPAVTQDRLREDADVERDDTGALFRAWHDLLGDGWVQVRAVLERAGLVEGAAATAGDSLGLVLALADAIEGCLPQGAKPNAKAFGHRLRVMRGAIVGGLRLVSQDDPRSSHAKVKQWRVVRA